MASILGMEISPISHLPPDIICARGLIEDIHAPIHNNILPLKLDQSTVTLRLTEWILMEDPVPYIALPET
jgi:hypothetical protein